MFRNMIDVENEVYNLNYNVSLAEDSCIILSVSKECNNIIVDKSIVRLAPLTFESIVEISKSMCRNTVTPAGFREIVEELIINKIIVE